ALTKARRLLLKLIGPVKLFILAALSLTLTLAAALPRSASAQSSNDGGDIGTGNVQVSGAGGFSENILYGSPGPVQGGTYSAGTPLPINFYVYGVSDGMYVIASCV